MKKGVKIFIVFLLLVIVGLTTYIAVDKLVLSKEKVEKKENNVVETNEVGEQKEEKEANTGKIILAEINKKDFLSKNGIEEEDVGTLKYCVVETDDDPIYIVLVDYQVEGEAGHGNIFQATYKDRRVNFDKIEDHKYISDVIAYDSNKEILKLSAEYHGGVRTNYFKLSNGKFEEIDLAVADGSKEYNFVELKKTEIKVEKKSTKTESGEEKSKSSSLNGLYKREDSSKATSGTLEISEDNGDSFKFKIDASHVNGVDIEAAIERGAVSMGGTEGTAKKVSDGVYEFVPEDDDEIWEYWEGEYKITFTKTADNTIQIKETYDKDKHSEGPYGGHNVWFDGTYTK